MVLIPGFCGVRSSMPQRPLIRRERLFLNDLQNMYNWLCIPMHLCHRRWENWYYRPPKVRQFFYLRRGKKQRKMRGETQFENKELVEIGNNISNKQELERGSRSHILVCKILSS